MLELYYTPLTQIPILMTDNETEEKINNIVEKLVFDKTLNETQIRDYEAILNGMVYDIYHINDEEKQRINEFCDSVIL